MKTPPFKSPVCTSCGQTTHYDLNLDKGIAYIMIALYNRVRMKGSNSVHIQNEMATNETSDVEELSKQGLITFKMEKNVARARKHGLIAFVDRGSGEYLITRKGAQFLRGMPVPKTAIVQKSGGTQGYWHPDASITSIGELLESPIFWDTKYLDNIDPKEAIDIIKPTQSSLI